MLIRTYVWVWLGKRLHVWRTSVSVVLQKYAGLKLFLYWAFYLYNRDLLRKKQPQPVRRCRIVGSHIKTASMCVSAGLAAHVETISSAHLLVQSPKHRGLNRGKSFQNEHVKNRIIHSEVCIKGFAGILHGGQIALGRSLRILSTHSLNQWIDNRKLRMPSLLPSTCLFS